MLDEALTKFSDLIPSAQNAIDIFAGHWASSFPRHPENLRAGDGLFFTADNRPFMAANQFGGIGGRLDRFRVCELGPLEAGHTWQLENLGANVIAIEGNAEAFLKCLITKEVLNMKASFYHGDFLKYLQNCNEVYDMIFASGVLYHMTEPLSLIESICKVSDRCFIWSHYYDDRKINDFREVILSHSGAKVRHYQRGYGDRSYEKFWGGLADSASWLRQEDILEAFRRHGHSEVKIFENEPDHPNGPSFSFATWRP